MLTTTGTSLRPARRAAPLGAMVDAVVPEMVRRTPDERLKDTVLANALGEFFDFGIGELDARVVRVFGEPIDRHQQRTPDA